MRDTTTVIVLRKGVRPKPKKLTGKQLKKHFDSQLDDAYEMMNSLRIQPIPNLQLRSANQEGEWVDLEANDLGNTLDENNEEDPILMARRLLQTDSNSIKRRNAKNREQLAQNWSKVRPMMVQYATGRALPECDCQERKEKVITIISLTGKDEEDIL
ncbi:hypothetical protein BGX38DRAFT_1278929 [Terfezia claveryi]|nr:hypothetical protein BGX38DRAFT_1278929 [Terfezia claveryi]